MFFADLNLICCLAPRGVIRIPVRITHRIRIIKYSVPVFHNKQILFVINLMKVEYCGRTQETAHSAQQRRFFF